MNIEMSKIVECIQKKSLYSGLQNIIDYVEDVERQRDNAINKLSEWNKDVEIQKLKEQLHNLQNRELYIMSDKTYQMRHLFENKHANKCKCHTMIYELSYTGIGTSIVIKCPVCGEEENITDYKEW